MADLEATLFDQAPVAMLYFDDQLRLRRVNQAAVQLWHRPAKELIGSKFAPLVLPGLEEQALRLALSGTANKLDASTTLPGGTAAHLSISYTPLQMASRCGVLVAVSEMAGQPTLPPTAPQSAASLPPPLDQPPSSLIEAEPSSAAVPITRDQFRAVLDNMTEGVLLVDSSGQQLYLNHAGRMLTGLDEEQALPNLNLYKRPSVTDVAGNELDISNYPISRALKGERFSDVLIYFTTQEGTSRLLANSGSSIKDEQGRVQLAIATFRDVSELHRLEAELRQSRDELVAVLDNMPDAVSLVEPDGTVRYLNPVARQLFGISPDEPLGRIMIDGDEALLPGEEADSIQQATILTLRALRGEVFTDVELELLSPDGILYLLSVSGSSVRDSNGTVQLGVTVARDITERRELERLKDEFISITSHELRTPLTTIKGQAQLLMRRLRRLDDDVRHDLEKSVVAIEERAERMRQMVDDLLDSSRVAAGRLEIQSQPFALTTLVDKVANELRVSLGRAIQTQMPSEPIMIKGEERLIEEVLTNLIGNAAKYSPADSVIEVSLSDEQGEVIVAVSDQGIGITKEGQARLFERFYRSDSAKAKAGGLGLGLYIAAGIVAVHGGRIWAQSEGEGKGSTFYFTLPLPNQD